LGWLLLLGAVGAAVMNPAARLMFFVIAAVVAAILALVAKHKPARVTRIIMAVGALVFAGLSYPEAAAWADLYRQHRDRASANDQDSPAASAKPQQ
jgi:4-amino-4-deoxy-L-arabinose transferase-like glycosyltransferase